MDEPMETLPGVYRAVVTGRSDPLSRSRVTIRVPSVWTNEELWAEVVAHGSEAFALEPGDVVIVAFEAGDPHAPYVLGTLQASADVAPD
jgi:hypothetical protein